MLNNSSQVISKPWGIEFELFSTSKLAVWCLHIDKTKSTSLHCHPKKRTGYIVASGQVEVEFLSSTRILSAGDRINFRPGVFHRTRSLKNNTIVLELESPLIKQDLLRLEDESGRVSSNYETETKDQLTPEIKNLLTVGKKLKMLNEPVSVGGLTLEVKFGYLTELLDEHGSEGTVALLEGDVFANEKYLLSENVRLLNIADVTSVATLKRMLSVINVNNPVRILIAT